MGRVGPNGAGKTTTLRISDGPVRQERRRGCGVGLPDAGRAGSPPSGTSASSPATCACSAAPPWPGTWPSCAADPAWDERYAQHLLERFPLHPSRVIKSMSHGERMKAPPLLAVARRRGCWSSTADHRPRSRGAARAHDRADGRPERRGAARSSSRRTTRTTWSRSATRSPSSTAAGSSSAPTRRRSSSAGGGCTSTSLQRRRYRPPRAWSNTVRDGHLVAVTTSAYTPAFDAACVRAGIAVRDVQRMTLEEIFVATVMRDRRERAA